MFKCESWKRASSGHIHLKGKVIIFLKMRQDCCGISPIFLCLEAHQGEIVSNVAENWWSKWVFNRLLQHRNISLPQHVLVLVQESFKHLSHHQVPVEEHPWEDDKELQLGQDQLSCAGDIGFIISESCVIKSMSVIEREWYFINQSIWLFQNTSCEDH